MGRRTPGQGTVVKRVKRGKVYFVARVPWGDGGSRERWCKTSRLAEVARAQLVAERDEGQSRTASTMTVAEFLEEWITVRRNQWAGSTARNYVGYSRRYIILELGKVKLTDLTPRQIDRFYVTLETKYNLARYTISSVRQTFRTALQYAIDIGVIQVNPVSRTKAPRRTRTELQVLNVSEAARLVAHVEGQKNAAALLLMLTTAVRGGELLALRWTDIDMDTGAVIIRRAAKAQEDTGRLVLAETKNRSSTRTVVAPRLVIDALKRHRVEQAEKRLAAETWADPTLVFPNENGAVGRHHRQFGEPLGRALAAAKLPHLTPHGLRHSCASILLATGHGLPEVAALLGHSNPSITMSTYSHMLPGDLGKSAVTMARLLDVKSPEKRAANGTGSGTHRGKRGKSPKVERKS